MDGEVEIDASIEYMDPVTIRTSSPQVVSTQAKEEVIKSLTNLVKSKSRMEVSSANGYAGDEDLYQDMGNGIIRNMSKKESIMIDEPKIKLMKVDIADIEAQQSDDSSEGAPYKDSDDENQDPPELDAHRSSAKGSLKVPMKKDEGTLDVT
jgi:hypothetical protein